MEPRMFQFRLPADLREGLKKAAQAERRSMSNIIVVALQSWLEENNYWVEEATYGATSKQADSSL